MNVVVLIAFYWSALDCTVLVLRHSNIFDNMMSLMERYANNLETVVAERTVELHEEKKKTEMLLHRMLPP